MSYIGSPPRGRGKVFIGHGDGAPLGITPAGRGKLANIGDDIGDDGLPLLLQKLFNFTLTHDSRGIFWCFGRCFNQLCNQLKITVHFRCCHFIHVLTFFLRELPLHGRERLCKHSCNSPCPDYSRLCGKILRFRFDETFFSGITPQGGEKSDVFRVRVAGEGSPPHGRGKVGAALLHPLAVGITPA